MLCANVGKEFFISLGFVFFFHFIERIAYKGAGRLVYPRALRATVALKVPDINPDKSSQHRHSFLRGSASQQLGGAGA
jgi:hypothetical protein